jgi:hypothetical protein
MIIQRMIDIAPNEKFRQLHQNKRTEKQVNPRITKIGDFIWRIGVVVKDKQQYKAAE